LFFNKTLSKTFQNSVLIFVRLTQTMTLHSNERCWWRKFFIFRGNVVFTASASSTADALDSKYVHKSWIYQTHFQCSDC